MEFAETYRMVIVGCGPSGLAAANAYLEAGGQELLVLEAGAEAPARRRDHPEDILQGVGGTGLYSDGKFSFHPSATHLWQLEDEAALRGSFDWVRSRLVTSGVPVPDLPATLEAAVSTEDGFKPYPSFYLDLEKRFSLIEALYGPVAPQVALHSRVERIEPDGEGLHLQVKTPSGSRRVHARHLIGAGGRFFPMHFPDSPLPRRFARLELGVRLEGPADHPFLVDLKQAGGSIDPKWILRSPDGAHEWRTFCFCQQGEVVATRSGDMSSVSGRSDCPPTGRSSVGFHVRFTAPEAAVDVDLERLRGRDTFVAPLPAVLESPAALSPHLGEPAAAALHRGLRQLAMRFPGLETGAGTMVAHGPAVEGVGEYPELDAGLRVPGLPAHVVGDASGRFRGIVAALLSGHYVGTQG